MLEEAVVVEDTGHLGCLSHPFTEEVVLVPLPSLDIPMAAVVQIITTVVAYPSRIAMEATIRTIMVVVVVQTIPEEVVPCPGSHIVVGVVTSQGCRIARVSLAVPEEEARCNPCTGHFEDHYIGCYLLRSSTLLGVEAILVRVVDLGIAKEVLLAKPLVFGLLLAIKQR